MDRQIILNQKIREELRMCQNLYDRLHSEFAELASGAIIERNGNYNRFYRENGRQCWKKISDENDSLLYELRKKKYIKSGLPILEKKIKACKCFLKNDVLYDPVGIGENFLEQYKKMHKIDVFLESDINPDEWNSEDYVRGTMHSQNLIHEVSNGFSARSKSETMIAMRLKEKGIKFRYEPEVKLGRHKVFPDFEILLEKRRRVVYWEHFGMMDDSEYAVKALKKLQEYAENNIILGYNLVITYETKEKPLTLIEIDKIINKLLEIDAI